MQIDHTAQVMQVYQHNHIVIQPAKLRMDIYIYACSQRLIVTLLMMHADTTSDAWGIRLNFKVSVT